MFKTFKIKERINMKHVKPNKKKSMKKLLSKFDGIKKVGENKWKAKCPVHADTNPSLSITLKNKRILIKCYAGCKTEDILSAKGLSWSDLSLNKKSESVLNTIPNSLQHCNSGCCLKDYARYKGIPAKFLKELGLRDNKYGGMTSLLIPYKGESGQETAIRYRTNLTGDDRFRWKQGAHLSMYGLWKLPKITSDEFIMLVEGESDCHTLWYHGIPALGLPGATNFNDTRDAIYLKRFETVYAVIEPDKGGETLKNALKNSSILNQVKVVNFGKHKDPSGLYLSSPKAFKKRLERKFRKAVPLNKILSEEAIAERKKAWTNCKEIAKSDNILKLLEDDLSKLGVVGEDKLSKAIYLALTTRFFEMPVSIVVKGSSSTGKSFVEEKVVSFFPPRAYYKLTASSEKSMIYSGESYKNRFVIHFEAGGIKKGFQDYIYRTLMTEGCIKYEVTEQNKEGKFGARTIEKEGPTGFITTTTKISLHNENETRYLSFQSDDSTKQTRSILLDLAKKRTQKGRHEKIDISRWHDFHVWLEHKEHRVTIPFAQTLSSLIDAKAPRIRRDFTKILNLISAHALIHQWNRKKLSNGSIKANFEDYKAVYKLTADVVSAGVDSVIPKTVRRAVKVVKKLKKDNPRHPITLTDIGNLLHIHRSSAMRHVETGIHLGYLKNEEEKPGAPAKIVLGEPLPDDVGVLPKPSFLKKEYLAERQIKKAA
jgi:hypothetical protein